MNIFIYTASGLAGLYLVWLGLVMEAKGGFLASFAFKFVPMMLGLAALVSAGKSSGFL